jgi:hypothetical protein
MKTVIITRKYWGMSSLRSTVNGKQCCLGFCARSFGVPAKDLLNRGFPASLAEKNKVKFPDWMLENTTGYTSDVEMAIGINDNAILTMEEKETQLKLLFLKHDIKLVFRGNSQ